MRTLRSSGGTNVILEELETRRLYSAVALVNQELHRPPMCIADLNHDGLADAVVAYRRTSGGDSTMEIDTLINDGKGTFVQKGSFFFDDNNPLRHQFAADITVGDLDGDGSPDIALKLFSITAEVQPVGASPTDAISISVVPFFGDPKGGGFTQGKEIALPHKLSLSLTGLVDLVSPDNGLAIGDVDGDGSPDIVSWQGGDNIAVALMNGRGPRQTVSLDGSFSKPLSRGFSQTLGLADMDGDKRADLVACVNGQFIYESLNTKSPKSVSLPLLKVNEGVVNGAFLADVDGDGAADDIVATTSARTWYALSINPPRWSAIKGTFDLNPSNVLVGDVDGDGFSDFFTITVKSNHDIAMNAIRNIKA